MTVTKSEIEAAAKAIFWCLHAVMHDHEKEWKASDRKALYRECAEQALKAANAAEMRKAG